MNPRRILLLGGALAAGGLAIAATAPLLARRQRADRTHAQQLAGGIAVLSGWALLGWGIHRFGRSHPSEWGGEDDR